MWNKNYDSLNNYSENLLSKIDEKSKEPVSKGEENKGLHLFLRLFLQIIYFMKDF